MCGIAGIFSQELINIEYSKKEEIISKMVASIKHRGPDDDDIWISDCIALGHSRLSILDLSKNGNQPMHSRSGRFKIVFNGEIYNHQDLRKLLMINMEFRLGEGHQIQKQFSNL